jgi:hypothetical protein
MTKPRSLQPVVEALEDEGRVGRHVEGDDDRRLQRSGSSVSKPSARMPSTRIRQLCGIAPPRPATPPSAAMLRERLVEGDDDVDRRREAALRGLLDRLPLVGRSRLSAWALPLARRERLAPAMTKPSPGTPSMHLLEEAATRLER